MHLPDGESNPGLPRDRRGYLPLYYRGLAVGVVGVLGGQEVLVGPRIFFSYLLPVPAGLLILELTKEKHSFKTFHTLCYRYVTVKNLGTPSSRIRTSDLWITALQINYSPPLYQLSYRRKSGRRQQLQHLVKVGLKGRVRAMPDCKLSTCFRGVVVITSA